MKKPKVILVPSDGGGADGGADGGTHPRPAYMDHHATTPLDPRALDAMLPYLSDAYGNASSTDNSYGREAMVAVELARRELARLVNAKSPTEILFTSGATESDNIAILGTMGRARRESDAAGGGRPHMVTCATEHKAVLDAVRHVQDSRMGDVTVLPVDGAGRLSADALEGAMTDRTVLISVMAANNEVGTVHDLRAVGRLASKYGVLFHTDAAQAAGRIPVDVREMRVDMMSVSGHKMYGPKGVGALYVRTGLRAKRMQPLAFGGGQEGGMRPGTLNVPAIVGFGRAALIAKCEMEGENRKFAGWTSRMRRAFEAEGGRINGDPGSRLPHNVSVTFPGVDGKAVINSVSDVIAISAGSACTTQSVEPSHVLLALGLSEEDAHASIRIGVGRFNTDGQVDLAIQAITDAVRELGGLRGAPADSR